LTHRATILAAAVSVVALGAGGALAQKSEESGAARAPDIMERDNYETDFEADMTGLDRESLRGAFRVDDLVEEADVYGQDGDEIGEVEDIVIGPDGRVVAMIVEAGGFLDIGDTHFRVPWEEVEIRGYDDVRVPLVEDNIADYDVLRDRSDERLVAQREWRASELIEDYAYLSDGSGYGYVDDMLIGQDGEIRAVVVEGGVQQDYGGPYALPWSGYDRGWRPGFDRYHTGVAPDALADIPVIREEDDRPYWSG